MKVLKVVYESSLLHNKVENNDSKSYAANVTQICAQHARKQHSNSLIKRIMHATHATAQLAARGADVRFYGSKVATAERHRRGERCRRQ